MSIQLHTILPVLERIAPVALAEPWDNVGLLLGDPAQSVSRVLLTIDYTLEVEAEALARGCSLVIAYHPPIFEGLKRIPSGHLIHRAIRAGLALYSPHTAWDVAPGGANDFLGDVLGLKSRRPLRPLSRPGLPGLAPGLGLGRVGVLDPCSRGALLERIRLGLGLESLLVAGPTEGQVEVAAAGAGACGELIQDALKAGVGLYLTGEVRHHDALKAAQAGMTVVCTLHSNSERASLGRLKGLLEEALPTLELLLSSVDRDPFQLVGPARSQQG